MRTEATNSGADVPISRRVTSALADRSSLGRQVLVVSYWNKKAPACQDACTRPEDAINGMQQLAHHRHATFMLGSLHATSRSQNPLADSSRWMATSAGMNSAMSSAPEATHLQTVLPWIRIRNPLQLNDTPSRRDHLPPTHQETSGPSEEAEAVDTSGDGKPS